MKSILLFLCLHFCVAISASVDGGLEERVGKLKKQVDVEISAHREVVAQLEAFALHVTSLGGIEVDIAAVGQAALDQAKKLSETEIDLDEQMESTYFLMKDILKDVHDMMKNAPTKANDSMPTNVNEQKFYDLAMEMQTAEKWKEAYEFFRNAWAEYNETEKLGQKHSVDLVYLYEWMEFVAFKMDNMEEALWLCRQALTLEMNDFHRGRFKNSVDWYTQQLAAKNNPTETASATAKKLADSAKYENCKQENAEELHRKTSSKPNLFCRLSDRNRDARLIFAPVKEEILNHDPPVVFFHDLLLSWEVEYFKALTREKFSSAKILSHDTHKLGVEETTRKAKVAWLDTSTFPSLTRRLEAITRLDPYPSGAESYQVSKYDVGGHYIAHFDMLFDSAVNDTQHGDRVTTLLIYLNDVEEGGGTLFTQLNLHQVPEVGGALYWYNLRLNETYDMRTLHAACPVLKGEKWVVNKWFRIRGQIGRKPCALSSENNYTVEEL